MEKALKKRLETLKSVIRKNFVMGKTPALSHTDDCNFKSVDPSIDMPSKSGIAVFCSVAIDVLHIEPRHVAEFLRIKVEDVDLCLNEHVRLMASKETAKRYTVRWGIVVNGMRIAGEKV
jgi:hypothetical protein